MSSSKFDPHWIIKGVEELKPGDVIMAWTNFVEVPGEKLYYGRPGDLLVVLKHADEKSCFLFKQLFSLHPPYRMNTGLGFEKVGHIDNIEQWLNEGAT